MPFAAGTRFGPYETVAFLGAGGMGEVYEALDARLGRRVALKILPPSLIANEEGRRRFVQEAQLASSLQHPNIVTIFDIGSANEIEYLAMELVRGRTLDTLIPNKGLRADRCAALRHPDHRCARRRPRGRHRPSRSQAGQHHGHPIRIRSRFWTSGSPRWSSSASSAWATRPACSRRSKRAWARFSAPSPTCRRNRRKAQKVDARSDIFSFGAILYEMLSGQRAFRGDSTPATLAAVINLEPRPLTNISEGVPQPIERLVSRCLRKDLTPPRAARVRREDRARGAA